MICAAPGLLKPMVILRRQSNKIRHLCIPGHQLENQSSDCGGQYDKTAAGFCENPDATDNLVRDLEESDCPVDGAKEQFVPQPDSLTAESDR